MYLVLRGGASQPLPSSDTMQAFALANIDLVTLPGHKQGPALIRWALLISFISLWVSTDVEFLRVVEDGSWAVSACLGGQIRVWDLHSQRCTSGNLRAEL